MTKDLEEKAVALELKRKAFEQEADKLKPEVLNHFNKYINEVINPSIPEGYSLPPSKTCFYEERGFNIWTASTIKMPNGEFFGGPFEFERTIMDLTEKYKENNPWISRVTISFDLSK